MIRSLERPNPFLPSKPGADELPPSQHGAPEHPLIYIELLSAEFPRPNLESLSSLRSSFESPTFLRPSPAHRRLENLSESKSDFVMLKMY